MKKSRILLGNIDPLTGLMNISAFMPIAENMLKVATKPLTFVYFDVKNFKSFNQKYGYEAGNGFLVSIAKNLQLVYQKKLVARLNDDHFICVLDEEIDRERLTKSIEKVQTALQQQHDSSLAFTLRAGVYTAPMGLRDITTAIDRAKIAATSVKGTYNKNYAFFDEGMEQRLRLSNHIINHFHNAMKDGTINVYYQPEVRVLTRNITGFEALARWNDKEYGMISPGVFISVLEDANLVDQLDLFILRRVCEDFETIKASHNGSQIARISVNISRKDFALIDVFEEVEKIRKEFNVPVKRLRIEVTESAFTTDDDNIISTLKKMRAVGYEVWLDDFGSGYSSLNTLKDFEIDVLKIDMVFLRSFATNPRTKRILSAVVNLAKDLGMRTIAEGVETEEQFEFLRYIGCEMAQGYLFGRPKPLGEATDLYRKDDSDLEIEKLSLNAYYDAIGEFNVLSSFPFMPREKRASLANDTAIVLLEHHKQKLNVLYRNKAFINFLESVALKEDNFLGDSHFDLKNKNFYYLLEKCRESGEEEGIEFVLNGSICNARVKCLGKSERGETYALVLTNLSNFSHGRQAAYNEVAIHHLLEIYIRIDLYDINGTVQNIYINSTQHRVAETKDTSSRKAVYEYASRYIKKGERWRFCRFYDMRTAMSRLKANFMDYLTAFFHTTDELGHMRMVMYVIVPFMYGGRLKLLSCVRDAGFAEEHIDQNFGAVDMAPIPPWRKMLDNDEFLHKLIHIDDDENKGGE